MKTQTRTKSLLEIAIHKTVKEFCKQHKLDHKSEWVFYGEDSMRDEHTIEFDRRMVKVTVDEL